MPNRRLPREEQDGRDRRDIEIANRRRVPVVERILQGIGRGIFGDSMVESQRMVERQRDEFRRRMSQRDRADMELEDLAAPAARSAPPSYESRGDMLRTNYSAFSALARLVNHEPGNTEWPQLIGEYDANDAAIRALPDDRELELEDLGVGAAAGEPAARADARGGEPFSGLRPLSIFTRLTHRGSYDGVGNVEEFRRMMMSQREEGRRRDRDNMSSLPAAAPEPAPEDAMELEDIELRELPDIDDNGNRVGRRARDQRRSMELLRQPIEVQNMSLLDRAKGAVSKYGGGVFAGAPGIGKIMLGVNQAASGGEPNQNQNAASVGAAIAAGVAGAAALGAGLYFGNKYFQKKMREDPEAALAMRNRLQQNGFRALFL